MLEMELTVMRTKAIFAGTVMLLTLGAADAETFEQW
jgi:hypothetical protein